MKYFVLDPHAKVIKKWLDNGDLPEEIAVSATEQRFFAQCANAKRERVKNPSDEKDVREFVTEAEEDPQRPIRRQITKVYRVRNGGSEYLYFTETLQGQKFHGPYFDHSRAVGKYQEPIFDVERNRETGDARVVGIHHKELRYEIPFAEQFIDPSTGKTITLQDLRELMAEDCKFFVKPSNDKPYQLKGVMFDEWATKPFAELIEYGKAGKWPAPTAVAEEAPKVARGKKAD